MNVRSSENLYWQNFARQHKHCFGDRLFADVPGAVQPSLRITSDDALTPASNQASYFKSIDDLQKEVPQVTRSTIKTDNFGIDLRKETIRNMKI